MKKNKGKSKSTVELERSEEECPHCKDGPEAYRMIYNLYKLDVDLSRKLVSDGREPVELEPDDVRYALEQSHIYPQHLAHVDTKYPGIVAHFWYPEKDGTMLHGTRLIDGHHRAAKCLEMKIPFYVYLLTKRESIQVTVRAPGLEQLLRRGDQFLDDNVESNGSDD